MAVFEVPLTAQPQTFQITLSGVAYRVTLKWREAEGAGWVFDFANASGTPIVSGLPLVTGADLLEQYRYLGFGGSLYVQTDHDPDAVPTFDNLGDTAHVYFVPD